MSCLCYLCLLTYSGVQHILCFWFVFLRLVYPMLPVSLNACLIYIFLYLFAFSGVQHILCCIFVLFVFVLCTLQCQFLWIVHFYCPFGIP